MFTRKIDLGGALLFVALMAALPLLFRNAYLTGVLTVAVIYAIWAVSWDFMSGLTGRENFGHSLFIGAGAYTAGFLNTVWGFDGWWSIPAAMVVASLFALVMGFPTLRLIRAAIGGVRVNGLPLGTWREIDPALPWNVSA